MSQPRFNIFTGLLKAYEENGKKKFRTTASSTISDLAGDEILPPAIEKMATKAQDNLTIFLNHEYRVPEDVLGSCVGTSMQTRGVDSEGNPIVDLDFDIDLNESNPRAVQTYEAIKSGVKLGTSIGAIVRHAEKKKGGGLRIDDLELLEASIVGIPANPRSWVQYALKSINAVDEQTQSSFMTDEESVIEKEAVPSEPAEVHTCGELCKDGYHFLEEAATCKSCGHAAGCDCTDCSCKKAIEPDKEARTRVTVTVDEGTQEAPKSDPGAVLMDEDRADVTSESDNDTLGDDLTRDVEPEHTAEVEFKAAELETLVTKLQALVTENDELRKQHADLVTEHNDLKENFAAAREIIDRIADLPIGRKTAFKGAVTEFRAKYPMYDNEFMKFLEKD